MNVRRGLIRLWLALVLAWGVYVGYQSWGPITNVWLPPVTYLLTPPETFTEVSNILQIMELEKTHEAILLEDKVTILVDNTLPPLLRQTAIGVAYAVVVEPRSAEKWERRLPMILRAFTRWAVPAASLLLAGLAGIWVWSGFRKEPWA